MDRLFPLSPLTESARSTVKLQKVGFILLIFGAVYLISSIIGSILLIFPMVGFMLSDPSYMASLGAEGMSSQELAEQLTANMPEPLMLFSLFMTAATIVTVLVYCLKFEKRRCFSLGLSLKGAVRHYAAGLGIGLLMFSLAVGMMFLFGEAEDFRLSENFSLATCLLFFLGFMIQGFSEEFLVRSYLYVSLTTCIKPALAVGISSAAFAVLHAENPGITPLAVVNLFLFGVFAALYFHLTGNVWGIAAVHTVWNFAQGNLFGIRVSGMSMGGSLFAFDFTKREGLFSGGAFGAEGGLGVTVVLLLGIALLAVWGLKKKNAPEKEPLAA